MALAYSLIVTDARNAPASATVSPPQPLLAWVRQAQAEAGHFDELRGRTAPGEATVLRAAWSDFLTPIATEDATALNQRAANLARQIHDNGVTYNVYADEHGPQRPWSLDLFPLIIDPSDWLRIASGVRQRMHLLEAIMADIYGPQALLAQGLLPPALVHGHPGYVRALHGVPPVGGRYLQIAAFDLVRDQEGLWWILGQRCQAPSGLGYLLENRLAIAGQFPEAFQAMRVQRLAATYRSLVQGLKQRSPAGADAHLALLTPGPYNETYFEHAYLARYLGLTLVEGSDLVVRDERLYLKTLKALVPVHGLLKRVDDQYLDPLELLPESTLGVPGLLQAIRAGHVMVANMPGSAPLESPALLGFLPALSRHLLGEELQLPSLPTWWCGEDSARQDVLSQWAEHVIKPTYPGSPLHPGFETVLARTLDPAARQTWAARLATQGNEHTVQAYQALSQMPTWQVHAPPGKQVQPRSALLRVFAVCDEQGDWRVLPGGLARLASSNDEIASMQRGGSSADVWALSDGEVDPTTLLSPPPVSASHRKRLVTSRAAENLFWLGRYTERSENAIRLARLTLECLNGDEQDAAALLDWLSQMAVAHTLVLPGVPSASQTRRVFERSLIASLGSTTGATSVGYNLRALKMAASAVRERLSQEQWTVIVRAEEEISAFDRQHSPSGDYASPDALSCLKRLSGHLAAITGAQTDRMTRDDGWRLLSIGRHIERLGFLAPCLEHGFATGAVHSAAGFEAMIAVFDCTITFHAQYQQSRDLGALLELLVLDPDNPRSLGWVAHSLRARLSKLAQDDAAVATQLLRRVPDPGQWQQALLIPPQAGSSATGALGELLTQCRSAAYQVSDALSATYFTHSDNTNHSVGA